MTVGATPERFLTVREAARRLKVSTATEIGRAHV
jgi:hypothetical protein